MKSVFILLSEIENRDMTCEYGFIAAWEHFPTVAQIAKVVHWLPTQAHEALAESHRVVVGRHTWLINEEALQK
jgi:hypothetical protein